jgi:hypothetical protein
METGPARGAGGPPSIFFSVDGGHSRISSFGTSQGARRRCFLALMAGAPKSPAPAPPRESAVDVCYVDGGRSRISISTSQGAPSTFSNVDGERSRIFSSGTSERGRCRHFLALMAGAPNFQLRHLQGSPPSMFVTLMVGAPGSLSAPPRGPPSKFSNVDGGRSRISSFDTS